MTLKCEDLKPRYSALKTKRMQPLRRGKIWLSGVSKAELVETCDPYGMKTGEAQYSRKSLQLKRKLIYKNRPAAGLLCETRRSGEKLTTSFSDEARSSLDDFCRKYKKADFDAVLVYDESAGLSAEGGPAAVFVGNNSFAGPDPFGAPGKSAGAKEDATTDGTAQGLTAPFKRIFRVYNGTGFVNEEYFFDPEGGLETRKVYKYDAKNNLTEMAELDFSGNQLSRETFTFNRITSAKTSAIYGQTDELLKKTVSQYREDSTLRQVIVYVYDAGAQLVSKNEIHFSSSGLREKELVYQGDFETPAYEYHYSHKLDLKGNWTEERKTKFVFFNGKSLPDTQGAPEITQREITYY